MLFSWSISRYDFFDGYLGISGHACPLPLGLGPVPFARTDRPTEVKSVHFHHDRAIIDRFKSSQESRGVKDSLFIPHKRASRPTDRFAAQLSTLGNLREGFHGLQGGVEIVAVRLGFCPGRIRRPSLRLHQGQVQVGTSVLSFRP